MARKAGDQLFRKTDFFRVVESANAKGLPIQRIDITRDGISLIVGEPAKTTESKNEWDEEPKVEQCPESN